MEQSESGRFTQRPLESGREASPLVSCFWCQQLHPAEHPLSVCPACTARYATLRSLEMSGSFPLSNAGIDHVLTRISPGNYALGYMDGDAFSVFYVGRSDRDLRQRLHEWVGKPSHPDAHASAAKAPWGLHQRGQLPVGAPALAPVENAESCYTHFAYSYASSAEAAYAKEWRNYDAFGGGHGLDNQAEPLSARDAA
jgi:hypothetical protein